jgi:GT2 family glycosyltransferase
MALFRGKRIDQLDREIASLGEGEAAKVDRCVRLGNLAIITGWTTEAPEILIRGTFFSERYRRDDVEREIGRTGIGFVKACHLPGSAAAIDLTIRLGRRRFRSRLALSDDRDTLRILGLEQEQFLNSLRDAACQMLPEAADAFTEAFGQLPGATQAPEQIGTETSAAIRITAVPLGAPTAGQSEAAIDEVIAVGEHGHLVVGWCLDAPSESGDLRLLLRFEGQPERSLDLLPGAFRVARPDLLGALGPAIHSRANRAGFLRYLEAPEHTELAPTALLERAGHPISNPPLPPIKRFDDPLTSTHELLKHLHLSGQSMLELLDGQLGPALQDLRFPRSSDLEVEIAAFGNLPAHPIVSVIVPVYGRYDLVEFQLSQFANDPDFHDRVDLIYVLDDPSLRDGFLDCCSAAAPIYEVPFRCLTYPANLGFAGANNLGLRHSRCEQVLLLNSDVLPDGPGWVSELAERFGSLPDCGALGTRLLYPDGAIQHDGMTFKRLPSLAGLWINDHPGKGLPAMPVEPDRRIEPVPAVTAACVMLARQDLLETGGLDEGYIVGDFEDSDLCLALEARGRRTYVAHDVVLYHLERQSQALFDDHAWREKITVYNCWRHHRKWESAIERLSLEPAH